MKNRYIFALRLFCVPLHSWPLEKSDSKYQILSTALSYSKMASHLRLWRRTRDSARHICRMVLLSFHSLRWEHLSFLVLLEFPNTKTSYQCWKLRKRFVVWRETLESTCSSKKLKISFVGVVKNKGKLQKEVEFWNLAQGLSVPCSEQVEDIALWRLHVKKIFVTQPVCLCLICIYLHI